MIYCVGNSQVLIDRLERLIMEEYKLVNPLDI